MENINDVVQTAGDPAVLTFMKKFFVAVLPHVALIIVCAVVMAMTHPKSFREGLVALLVTFACAIYGPPVAIAFFHLDMSAVPPADYDKARSMLTILCGMPGWVIVRAVFNWTEINRTKTILDLAKQFKEVFTK